MADPQPVGQHGAMPHSESEVVYTKYATGDVACIAEQAANGGWLEQEHPIHGIVPSLDTIGSAGSYQAVPDEDVYKPADNLDPE